MGWGLKPVSAVDVVLHVQGQRGAAEKLGQGVLCDGSLLQNNHSILVNELVITA